MDFNLWFAGLTIGSVKVKLGDVKKDGCGAAKELSLSKRCGDGKYEQDKINRRCVLLGII